MHPLVSSIVVELAVRTCLARAGIHGLCRRPVENIGRHFVGSQEGLESRTEFLPTFAGLFEEGGTFLGRSRQSFLEQRFFVHGFGSGSAGDFFAKSSISFLKSSRSRMGSRSVSLAMCAASL
jgi:hypothetical protein